MHQYTVTLSEAENKALSFAALSQQEWIDHAVHERCRIAIEQIVSVCVAKCLQSGTQIPQSKDEMVELAFQNGWVFTAEQHNEITARTGA